MKNILKSFFLLTTVLFTTVVLHAQTNTKIVAVVNKADWCHVCQANGAKMMKEVMPVFENSDIRFVMNDLTNDATKKKSKKPLKSAKVYTAAKSVEATGLILLIDAASGKIQQQISVAEPADKIIMAVRKAAMTEKM